jgi:hypothetical protein
MTRSEALEIEDIFGTSNRLSCQRLYNSQMQCDRAIAYARERRQEGDAGAAAIKALALQKEKKKETRTVRFCGIVSNECEEKQQRGGGDIDGMNAE